MVLDGAKVMKPGSELNVSGNVAVKWVLFSLLGRDLGSG